jgi:hypothetical protein
VVSNVYNPFVLGYAQTDGMFHLFETYGYQLNEMMADGLLMSRFGYHLADVNLAFKNSNTPVETLTHVYTSLADPNVEGFDPHPTDAGHWLIFETHKLLFENTEDRELRKIKIIEKKKRTSS